MGTHETKRAERASAAIAALLASGVMFAGSAGVAVADPAVGHATSFTSENRIHPRPLSLGQIRAVVGHGANALDNVQVQAFIDKRGKALRMLSNILKRSSNHSTENVK